ncbi:hypothetical protein BS47DRAFT_879658 [Hydnum rufescens UP504]|uniref:Uncharacterized protein n=1 Tax=Hydnum rufescens UP504 TaxID=1448309 RepID=A0A9P6DX91_9AGAM|nr:hypothetical protein BS47DRAFT_879658 [Hydnum rufescens UP504]
MGHKAMTGENVSSYYSNLVQSSNLSFRYSVYPHIPIVQMKWFLKTGKIAKGVSLAILGLLRSVLDVIPVPGAKAGIDILLDVVEGIDETSQNSSTLRELEHHIRCLTDLLEPLTKMDRNNLSSALEDDVLRLKI